jgi:hypothetical protein
MYPEVGRTYIPGTKRYVVLDKDGALLFESDDKAEAFAATHRHAVTLCDREFKPRVNTFAGIFTELPSKE